MDEALIGSEKKLIFSTQMDVRKAILITFIAYLFAGFQAAIYRMTTVPVSAFFGKDSSMIIFYDSFGMWGQILAMATRGFVISRIKAKNTLFLAGSMMIVASSLIAQACHGRALRRRMDFGRTHAELDGKLAEGPGRTFLADQF